MTMGCLSTGMGDRFSALLLSLRKHLKTYLFSSSFPTFVSSPHAQTQPWTTDLKYLFTIMFCNSVVILAHPVSCNMNILYLQSSRLKYPCSTHFILCCIQMTLDLYLQDRQVTAVCLEPGFCALDHTMV